MLRPAVYDFGTGRLLEAQQYTREEIVGCFQVPLRMLGGLGVSNEEGERNAYAEWYDRWLRDLFTTVLNKYRDRNSRAALRRSRALKSNRYKHLLRRGIA